MTNMIKSNLKFLVTETSMLAPKTILTIGSIIWITWCILIQYHPSFLTFDDEYAEPIVLIFGLLFTLHIVLSYNSLILNDHIHWLRVLTSAIGTIAWSGSTIIIVMARIHDSTMPMGGAHWTMLILAWWIFLRDCSDDHSV